MKSPFLTGAVSTLCSRLLLGLALLNLLSVDNGCGFSRNPSKTVENLYRTVERGDVEQAMTFFSSGMISNRGIGPFKAELSATSVELKEHGGIKSIKVLKEDVVGDMAEVTVEVTGGNGNVVRVAYKLIREQGAWKIDGVNSDSPSQATEPLHPESAVEDVVKWANEAGAATIKSWLQKQSQPAVCTASAIDRATLPDEVKYHDVDDPKARGRLLSALDPVLKLVGCSNKQGILLYKGSYVYSGNLDGGQIAITPGDSYFIGSPPDEKIFHALAELRIFLAREVFRQMIPVEKPNAGLNDADMRLRRDLKLNYLAGLASLAIDHDPNILDRVALDIDLYARPVGIVSGTQGTPSLRQIEDVFGAAKQDYRE